MPAPLRALLGHPHLTALRQRRWFKPATRALAALLGVWALSWLSVPALVKGPLERLASEQLGRTVTVGSLDFKPWSLELTLRDIAVAGAKGTEGPAQLTIGRVYVDAELQSVLRLAPVVDAFTVENPVLRLTHLGQGRYDVDDVIAKLTAPIDRARAAGAVQPAAAGRARGLHRQRCGQDAFGAGPAALRAVHQHAVRQERSARGAPAGIHAGRQPF